MKTLALMLTLIFSAPDKFIILTTTQARAVKARYGEHSELQPVKLVNGEWVLPVKVLRDPDLKDAVERLKNLPQREVKPEEFPKPELQLEN